MLFLIGSKKPFDLHSCFLADGGSTLQRKNRETKVAQIKNRGGHANTKLLLSPPFWYEKAFKENKRV